MSDDEGVDPGTPEFEAAAMEGLMSNLSLPWADRVACGQKAINILRGLLADAKRAGVRTPSVAGCAYLHTDCLDASEPRKPCRCAEVMAGVFGVRGAAGPRTWELPAEPGPEVTAVRDKDGNVHTRQAGGTYPNGVVHVDGWVEVNGPFVRSWERLVTKLAPLTDVTGETGEPS